MFKTASFEEEIYRLMEAKLVSNQLENRYAFTKLTKAADLLHMAAEIFEQAEMIEQADEVTEVLLDLAQQLSSKTSFADEDYKKCNCEQEKCSHEAGLCKNRATGKKAMYIGDICNECAKKMPEKYLK